MIFSSPSGNVINWNIVNKHFSPGLAVKEALSRKIARLAKHLNHLPPETLHLHVVLEKLQNKEGYTVRLTLRLPWNIIHTEKSGDDLLRAIDTATSELDLEAQSVKADSHGDNRWKRAAYRAGLRPEQTLAFAEPMAEGSGPQTDADVVSELVAVHEARLLAHARRKLRMAELTGEIPQGWLDPGDIVDEAVRKCLAYPEKKRPGLTYEQWFYQLVSEQLVRMLREYSEEHALRGEPPLPERSQPALSDEALGYDAERPLDVIMCKLDSRASPPEDRIPDASEPPPNAAVAGRDLVELLQREVKNWPPHEQEIFELHYLVGFESRDIAKIRGLKNEEVATLLAKIQLRLRDFMQIAAI